MTIVDYGIVFLVMCGLLAIPLAMLHLDWQRERERKRLEKAANPRGRSDSLFRKWWHP